MEIIDTKNNKPAEVADTVKNDDSPAADVKEPLAEVSSASAEDAYKITPELKEAKDSMAETSVVDLSATRDSVQITEDDKARFIAAVINGTRFTAYAYLYGGRVRVKFRSRTLAETEAIMSYVHREGIAGNLVTKSDLSDTILAALLVAQVEEFGDVAYPEMKRPYKYTETSEGVKDPGWLADVDMWRAKPEHVTAAVGNALIEFEAKYWKMITESKNENFWKPGGSTGA